MTGHRDSFGDPAYLDGALGRIETGQPLRAVDVQELSYAIGREAALKLARTVEEDRAKAGRRSRPSGLWGWLFGPIHTTPELPVPLARLIARLRSGQPLSTADARAVARLVGRAGARAVSRRAVRGTRAAIRGLTRAQSRNATRRTRQGR
jgi:hypothetical protein